MLARLPNEILLQIFKKTKTTTTQECSLLNSRFCGIIRRDELHKRELIDIWILYIGDDKFGMRLRFADASFLFYNDHTQYEQTDFLHCFFSRVRTSVGRLKMRVTNIPMKNYFVYKIMNHKALRHLSSLKYLGRKVSDSFVAAVMSLKLDVLAICMRKENIAHFPIAFFENVANHFVYVSEDTANFSHFTDEVLAKRRLRCKGELRLLNCITGLTATCIEQQKKKFKDFVIDGPFDNKWRRYVMRSIYNDVNSFRKKCAAASLEKQS